MLKKRVTYRPSKSHGAFGVVWGGIFVLIGLFVVIPTFGAFGVLWTLAAVAITAMNGYQAFGKKYVGPEIHIEDLPVEDAPQDSAASRLEELRDLYERRLITAEEYEAKKQEILKEL